jgi:prolyl oligopeptidase PreP (S9A serine peptidase family)
MRHSACILTFVITITSFLSITNAQGKGYSGPKLVYPKVHQVNKTWSFRSAKANGNVTYFDPFYWLEGDSDDTEIKKFISDQLNVTETYIQGCKNKDAIIDSLTQASSYEKYSTVTLVTPNTGETPFYLYILTRSGDQLPLWYTASVEEFQNAKKSNFESPPGKLFLDESKLSADGSSRIAINFNSPDGKVFGYLVSNPDTVAKWYFRNFTSTLINPKTYPEGGEGRFIDILSPSDNYIRWSNDSKSLFYPQVEDSNNGTNPNLGYQIRYHVLGNDKSNDITIFDSKNAGEHGLNTAYFLNSSPDGKWLIITGYYDTSNFGMVSYATMLTNQTISENMKWISLAPDYDFAMYPGGVVDDEYYFQTDKDALNQKVAKVKLDWSKARTVKKFTELQDRPQVIDVVPERNDAIIASYGIYPTAKYNMVVFYIEEGIYTTYIYNVKTGKLIQKVLESGKCFT